MKQLQLQALRMVFFASQINHIGFDSIMIKLKQEENRKLGDHCIYTFIINLWFLLLMLHLGQQQFRVASDLQHLIYLINSNNHIGEIYGIFQDNAKLFFDLKVIVLSMCKERRTMMLMRWQNQLYTLYLLISILFRFNEIKNVFNQKKNKCSIALCKSRR